MDKEIKVAADPDLNVVGNEPRSLALKGFKRGGDVVDMERDVVETLASLSQKSADRRVRGRGLEQLNTGVACGNQRGADLLLLDGFLMDNGEAERFVEAAGLS